MCPGAHKATTCMKWHDVDNAGYLLGSYATDDSPETTSSILFYIHSIDLKSNMGNQHSNIDLGHKTKINFIINLQADIPFNKTW